VNKALGPEMKSTGESILFIDDLKDDQFYELYSEENVFEQINYAYKKSPGDWGKFYSN
jgi:hypothetical protein